MDAGPEMVGQVYAGAGGSLLVECCAPIIIRLVQVAYWSFLGALLASLGDLFGLLWGSIWISEAIFELSCISLGLSCSSSETSYLTYDASAPQCVKASQQCHPDFAERGPALRSPLRGTCQGSARELPSSSELRPCALACSLWVAIHQH